MVRTQIQLTEEQAARVKRAARERGISMAEVVRRCIDRWLGADGSPDLDALYERAIEAAGALHDREGRTDVSERHDDYAWGEG